MKEHELFVLGSGLIGFLQNFFDSLIIHP